MMTTRQLHEFCRIVQGGRSGHSGNDFVPEGIPAYGAGGLNGYLPNYEFDEPAVILSSIGARCGKCFCVTGKWASLANTQLIFPDLEEADIRFIWFQLNDEKRWYRSGTGQPFIKPSDVKAHRVFLPPLSEQRRIAQILGKADALRTRRRAMLAQLDELSRSIFLDMFGEPAMNSKGWSCHLLSELILVGPQNGLYRPGTDYGSGTPILRIDGFYDGEVSNLRMLKRLRVSGAETDLFGLVEGDIVINRVNSREFLGKSALIPALPEPTVFESNMMRIRVDTARIAPGYLIQYLQTSFVRSQILRAAKDAVNQSSINQQDVKRLEVLLPPIELQEQFVNRIGKIGQIRACGTLAFRESDALFASLQHRAFRGEL